MNSIWQSLLWKEWREHRWKLAALAAIFALAPLFASLKNLEGIFGAASAVFYFAVPIASMVLATSIAAGERSRRTDAFLRALPAVPARAAAAKLVWAAITVTAPIILSVAVVAMCSWRMNTGEVQEAVASDISIYRSSWLIQDWYWARIVGASLAALSLLLWIAAASVNRSDEVRAAAIGLLVVVGFWAALTALGYALRSGGSPPDWWYPLAAGAPGGPSLSVPGLAAEATAATAGRFTALWPFAAVAVCSHVALATWFISQFGRIAPGRAEAPDQPVRSAEVKWLAPPRRSPLAAIFWQQARVSGPLAAAVAVAILMASVIFACYTGYRSEFDGDAMQAMLATSFSAWAGVGLFVAIVGGMAVFMDDLDPRLHNFWRSRPVSVNQWFAVKFGTGLALPLLIVPLPAISALVIAKLLGVELPDDLGEGVGVAVGFLVAQISFFCVAVLMIVLVRQAAYAAILTVAVAGLFAVALEHLAPGLSFQQVKVTCIAASAVAVFLAWIALRKDWGWTP